MSALACLWLTLAAASAEDLAARAHQAEEALEYDEAARFWLEVLALPELPAHRRTEAHLQLATAFVILGDQEGARAHFRRALTEEPNAAIAPHAPAKVRLLFEDVKSHVNSAAAAQRDQGPWVASTIALASGAASGVGAGVLLVLAASTESEALVEPEQLKRAAIYDRRDALVYGADAAAVGALALLAVSAIGWYLVVAPPAAVEGGQ